MVTFSGYEDNDFLVNFNSELAYFIPPGFGPYPYDLSHPTWAIINFTWNIDQTTGAYQQLSWKSVFNSNYDLSKLQSAENFAANNFELQFRYPLVGWNILSNDTDENISGLGGDDELQGRDGNDILNGNEGDDIIWGGNGDDDLIGGDGDDVLYGNDGYDLLLGGIGNDYMFGGADNDILHGSAGTDWLIGGAGTDRLTYENSLLSVMVDLGSAAVQRGIVAKGGDAEGDRFEGIENLFGSNSNDTLTGNDDNNRIYGLLGNDTIEGGLGTDSLDGGANVDTVSYRHSNAGVTITLADATINQFATASGGHAAGDILSSFENITGSAFADVLTGTAGANTIAGGAGNDQINGLAGNDMLTGGGGSDTIDGGSETDTLDYSSYSFGLPGVASDSRLVLSVNLTTGVVLEQELISLGGNNQDIYLPQTRFTDTVLSIEGVIGGINGDSFTGNANANQFDGRGGDDTFFTDAGADRYIGGTGVDSIDFSSSTAGVSVNLFSGLGTGGSAQGDTYTTIENVTGSAFNDTLTGNNDINRIEGRNGDDTLDGMGSDDFIFGGEGSDTIIGGGGGDQMWGGAGAGADQFTGGNGAGVDFARYDDANYGDLSLRLDNAALNTGTAAAGDTYIGVEGLVGGAGNDVVIGNALNNFLFGGGAVDFIDGQLGTDQLTGGAGADRFRYSTALNATNNVDTITDFVHSVDDILLLQTIFTAIGATLDATELRLGTAATDANDYLIYNSATGQLFYDANGNGAGGQTLFANVTAGTVLDTGDFLMV
jgi:Ca2+-binding RTX toxin-like protein